MKWAFETLQRYRKKFCMFNDDVQVTIPSMKFLEDRHVFHFIGLLCYSVFLHIIQGTAGVALAGLLGTVRAQGRPLSDFANQKIVVVGAGR